MNLTTEHLHKNHPLWDTAPAHIQEWHPHTWPQVILKTRTIPFAVLTNSTSETEPVAFLWFTVFNQAPYTLELHACANPKWHGRWLTLPVLVELLRYLYVDVEVRQLVAFHSDPGLRKVLKRIGFEAHGSFTHILNMEKPNVRLIRFLFRKYGG